MRRAFIICILAGLVPGSPAFAAGPYLIDTITPGKDGLPWPLDVEMESDGNLLVSLHHGVARYSPDGTLLGSWPDIDGLARPAADGGFYVLDWRDRIVRFDASGARVGEWPAYRPSDGVSVRPSPEDFTVDPSGNQYVTDSNLHHVLVLDPQGTPLRAWSTAAPRDPYPPEPYGIDYDPRDGSLVILDEARIKRFTTEGVLLDVWTNEIDGRTFDWGLSVDVDDRGTIYLAPYGPYGDHSTIVVWGSEGEELGVFGEEIAPPDGCWIPAGLASGADGDLWIGDECWGGRILHYTPYGAAFPPAQEAALLLHGDAGSALACSDAPHTADQVVTRLAYDPKTPGRGYFVFLLASPRIWIDERNAGLLGMQMGIQYRAEPGAGRGPEVRSWTSCGDLEFPQDNWPASGSGNTITWAACRSEELTVAGYFYLSVYDPASMSIIPYPVTGSAKVADCAVAELEAQVPLEPIHLGRVGFGVAGCDPLVDTCSGTVAVRPITWGRLKSRY